jgi:zinc finger protein
MTNPTQDDPMPVGAAFDDFFESIGKKAEQLAINDKSDKSPNAGGDASQPEQGEDEQKVVDEIESLCMNCHENVIPPGLLFALCC